MEPISIKQQRKAIKRAAKARVSAQLGACIGVRLLYLLPVLLVQLIVYARPAYAMLRAAADGAELPPLAGLYTGSPLGVQILLLIATGPLQFGLMRFYIGVQRGAEPDVSTLFAPYAALQSCWTGIKMMFCRAFRAFLWTMGPALLCTTLLTAALIGGMARAMRFGSDELAAVDTVLLLVMAVAFVVVMAAISIRVMAYDAGWVLLDEDETRSVWDATREAAQAFRGQYGGLAAFVLSFAGWYILIVAVDLGCLLLGAAGLTLLGGGTGMVVLLQTLLAALCLHTVLSGFLSAYFMTAFVGLFDRLRGAAAGDCG